jgi:beta-galactosidase
VKEANVKPFISGKGNFMQKQSLNQAWQFSNAQIPQKDWQWEHPKAGPWKQVDLPHDWSIEMPRSAENPSGNANGYFGMGTGFYEKDLTVPAEWAGKKVMVEFEGVYMNAEVRLDEHFLTRHPYGYTSFFADLTPFLRPGQTHKLKVRVDNSGQVNSRWYSGSGIYRPAWLIVCEPVHIAPWGFSSPPRRSRPARPWFASRPACSMRAGRKPRCGCSAA